jgi:hypothetical protein
MFRGEQPQPGELRAVDVLQLASERAVIAPPQAKHRQWPSFGR